MNKQGNTYTIIYITALVCVVGAVLAWVSLALKPKQDENVRIDKMQQMLSSIRVPSEKDNAISLYEQYVKESYVVALNANVRFSVTVASPLINTIALCAVNGE